MWRFLTEENFHLAITEGLVYRIPGLDIVRVQDVGLVSHSDEEILEWATNDDRILLTHDYASVPDFAYRHIEIFLPMPGVIAIPLEMPIGRAIDGIMKLIDRRTPEELRDNVIYVH